MRVLITGGAGCLGSAVSAHFLDQGAEILVIDNFATGSRSWLPDHTKLDVLEGRVDNVSLVSNAFESFLPTHVIHAAASYSDPDNWVEDVLTNTVGTAVVCQAAQVARVSQFVYLQTALCYGRPTTSPIRVDHPLAPFSSYGITKTAGEQFVQQLSVPWVSLRLANICAPHLSIGPIPTFYARLSDGRSCFATEAVRDFLDVSDYLALLDLVVDRPDISGAFNVSSGEGHSIREVFQAVAQHLGLSDVSVPMHPIGDDDVATVVLDPSETSSVYGWSATVDFDETISRQLQWYDANGVGTITSHLKPVVEEGA
jgi:UDP-glucose 4-epimerase